MVWSLIVGLIIGAIAKLLMPGKDPGGFIVTTLIGIAGSMIAHFVGVQTGMYMEGEPAGIFASVLGAVALLAIYRAVITRRHTTLPH